MNVRDFLLSSDPVGELYDLDATGNLRDFLPELADLRMRIPQGWRHKDNLTHSIKVLENAMNREESPDLILRTSALFHDIGKPATRKFPAKGKVTFTHHEVVGAKMLRQMLPKFGYSQDEIRVISKIVALHMRSFGFADSDWSDSAVRRLMNDAGDVLDPLLIVFHADITSKHKSKRNRLENGINVLSAEIDRIQEQDNRAKLRPALNGNEVMELFDMKPGKELGMIMRELNSDENIHLERDEAIRFVSELLIRKNI